MKSIAIIGSGITGFATGRAFVDAGHSVNFYDIDTKVTSELAQSGFSSYHINDLEKHISNVQYVFICLPTPTVDSKVEIGAIHESVKQVASMVNVEKCFSNDNPLLVTICSTVPVGTHRQCLEIIKEHTNEENLSNIILSSSPEYLREKTAFEDAKNPKAIIVGIENILAEQMLREVYGPITSNIYILTPEEAEMHKYIHNVFNANKISFFNEFRTVCEVAGIEPENIFHLVSKTSEGCWNPEYGTRDFGPFQGSCLPKDVEGFLTWTKEKNIHAPLTEAVLEVNNETKKKGLGRTEK